MINGGAKFFYQNYALKKLGASATATSNPNAAKYILNNDLYTIWESLLSNDTITETIVITLPFSKTIDRLFLVDMNFKQFNVKYYNGSAYVDFTNVIGVNGVSTSEINETVYDKDSAYYEFTPVSTTMIQIEVLKTQTVNAQKYLARFVATQEIGTFQGFPRIVPSLSNNSIKQTAISNKIFLEKGFETTDIKITFKTHPYQNDENIVQALFSSIDPFLVWICGGRTGNTYFKIDQRNWELKDLVQMQLTNEIKNEFEKGVYLLGINKGITLEEHV